MQLDDGTYVDLTQADLAPVISDVGSLEDEGTPQGRDNEERRAYRRRLQDRVLSFAERAVDETFVPVIFVRQDLPFDWRRLSDVGEAARDQAIAERTAQVTTATEDLAAELQRVGAADVEQFWIAPSVSALVPRNRLATLLDSLSEEWTAELNAGRRGKNQAAFGGEEARIGMRTTAFVNAGYDGSLGNRVNSDARIRAGIVEWMDSVGGTEQVVLNRNHYGFRWPGGGSRWGSFYRCPGGTCTITTPLTGESHGTATARILVGSIEGGQDPTISNGLDRRRRSGMLSGASVYFYGIGGDWCNGAIGALQTAVSQHVDVLNWSLRINGSEPETSCSRFNDCGGFNAAIANATDAGMLVVFIMGNWGPSSTCNASYPGTRKDALTVGALDTNPSTASYDSAPMWDNPTGELDFRGSGTGGMRVRQHNDWWPVSTFAVADLAAPGAWSYWYTAEPGVYSSSVGRGTSIAAPAVAGAAMQLRHAFKAVGWNLPSARALVVNMLLMGDGLGTSGTGFNLRSGAGRVKTYYPSAANLTSPWGWGWHSATLSNGQEACWNVGSAAAESTSITQWKGALTWNESSYDSVANIHLRLKDTCPASGPTVVVAQDQSRDIRKRVVVGQGSIGGRCLRACAYAASVRAGETRTVQIADYYHSGSTADH